MVTGSFVSERCMTQKFISLMQKVEFKMKRCGCPGNSGEALSVYAVSPPAEHDALLNLTKKQRRMLK